MSDRIINQLRRWGSRTTRQLVNSDRRRIHYQRTHYELKRLAVAGLVTSEASTGATGSCFQAFGAVNRWRLASACKGASQ